MRGQHILLGVTGGIAAYKSPDLVRRLLERGAVVQVVMTASAKEFITATTLQAVSGRPVRDSLWDAAAEAAMGHIELARWADLVLIAPASADFLARLAQGRADDLLSTLCLATTAPVCVAPAMNQQMWANAATQANVAVLQSRGLTIFGPASGEQACGEVGPGRMLEPTEIADLVEARSPPAGPLAGKRAVVTAGPTREAIDPVRFISNRSSGKMGYALAKALRDAGADVALVSGPVNLPTPAGIRRISVETAAQMHAAVMAEISGAHLFAGTAAVADYRPGQAQPQKIKKSEACCTLELIRTPDILAEVSARADRPFVVGFAAETHNVEHYAREKLLRKNLDLIAANEVGDCKAFDCDDNALLVLWRGGRRALPCSSKTELARTLVEIIVERLNARAAAGVKSAEWIPQHAGP